MSDGGPTANRPRMAGDSPQFHRLLEDVSRAAVLDLPVLIRGERGTGKELVACELHRASPRAKHKFLTVNIGSLNPSTRISELFGHEKHAFTGADRAKLGLFRAVEQGTLFLDEIGNCDTELQAALLRVLEYSEIVPIGGEEAVRVDVRVLAATNANLEEMVEQNKFRHDLLDRFPLTIEVPPLRDRGEDSTLIADLLLHENAKRLVDIEEISFTEEAEDIIRRYRWPGNVRELANRVRDAVTRAPRGQNGWRVPAEHLRIATELDSATPLREECRERDASPTTLADIVLDALLTSEEPVLDVLQECQELKYPGTRHFVEQLELGLERFLQTDVGRQLLNGASNAKILSKCFNLAAKTDSRKKSFARCIRTRLDGGGEL